MNRSVEFFDTQFRRQVQQRDFTLNPFEQLALPYLRGRVLDLGCGLGNLAIEAARRGCPVLAIDASPNAIQHITDVARSEALPIEALTADLSKYQITGDFHLIVSIGLLMFLKRDHAQKLLSEIKRHVEPGGCAIINALIEGTTYMDMFDPAQYYLFSRDELQNSFVGWELLESKRDQFEAPRGTVKVFTTIVARRPYEGNSEAGA